ncbi:MAG TPA: calcium-binding protein [Solirubrobacteraceae bacterium]
MRALLLVVCAVAGSAAAAAPAGAATASTETRCVNTVKSIPTDCFSVARYVAAPGEANAVTVAFDATTLVFADSGAPVDVAASCTRLDEHSARCPSGQAEIALGDGDDRAGPDPQSPGRGPLVVTGEAGDDVITGGLSADALDGGDGADVLRGGPASDNLAGGPGSDDADGEAGNDAVSVADVAADPAPDRASGGEDADTLQYTGEDRGVEVDLATGGTGGAAAGDVVAGFENVRGGGGADQLAGDDGPNVLSAGDGGGRVAGRGGDDALTGGAGPDTLDGGDGVDHLAGAGRDVDLLYGGPNDDLLETDSAGLVDAGDGDDKIDVLRAPPSPLRITCGRGDDVATTRRRTALGPDCEAAAFGPRVAIRRELRVRGRVARAAIVGDPSLEGRLVVRDLRRRRLGSGHWDGIDGTIRIRLTLAAARQVARRGSLPVTIEERRRPAVRATATLLSGA